ncbi:MAG TPA: UDP-2,3-diacylglucosamine diphosphatase [Longimicrobiales bacterium]
MSKPEFLASDIHLGAIPRERERAFLDFLEHVGACGGRLLIVGDLFDFWFEYGEVIPGKHFRVLAALADLVDSGIPVTLMGGNHDAWGGRFLREEVGVEFYPDTLRTEIAGRRALIAHGDGVGRGDLGYRILKAVIRSRIATRGFRLLHPELGMRIARGASKTEDRAGGDVAAAKNRARYIEEWAREQLRLDPELAWVVCGHAHLPAIHAVEPGRYYLNPGDWINHNSYITVSPAGVPELHQWTSQAARVYPSTSTRSI